MAQKPNGKGRGKNLEAALQAAKADHGGQHEWYEVVRIVIGFDNPLREYHVTIEPTTNPAQS